MTLSQNPHHPQSIKVPSAGLRYPDPRLFAKFALRDFLRDRYRAAPAAASDPLPRFDFAGAVPQYNYTGGTAPPAPGSAEAVALHQLNAAWNTSYTSWGSSASGGGWGKGTGWMDENVRSVCACAAPASFSWYSSVVDYLGDAAGSTIALERRADDTQAVLRPFVAVRTVVRRCGGAHGGAAVRRCTFKLTVHAGATCNVDLIPLRAGLLTTARAR